MNKQINREKFGTKYKWEHSTNKKNKDFYSWLTNDGSWFDGTIKSHHKCGSLTILQHENDCSIVNERFYRVHYHNISLSEAIAIVLNYVSEGYNTQDLLGRPIEYLGEKHIGSEALNRGLGYRRLF